MCSSLYTFPRLIQISHLLLYYTRLVSFATPVRSMHDDTHTVTLTLYYTSSPTSALLLTRGFSVLLVGEPLGLLPHARHLS